MLNRVSTLLLLAASGALHTAWADQNQSTDTRKTAAVIQGQARPAPATPSVTRAPEQHFPLVPNNVLLRPAPVPRINAASRPAPAVPPAAPDRSARHARP
ncbi:MAG: hypothetical protein JOY60_05915 [Burkholderiaceae bacterium]|nr:hypothetical protein [Burkholderiaceae bacterium]